MVNESQITGESNPAIKQGLVVDEIDEFFDIKKNNNNILYMGTDIIQIHLAKGQI